MKSYKEFTKESISSPDDYALKQMIIHIQGECRKYNINNYEII